MKAFRWLICFPGAFLASVIGYMLARMIVYSKVFFGERMLVGVWCQVPVAIVAALPTVAFVVAATLLSPSKSRGVVFVFFGLSILCSAGGVETLKCDESAWLAAALGLVVGAVIGLSMALRIQRKRTPNQTTLPTPV